MVNKACDETLKKFKHMQAQKQEIEDSNKKFISQSLEDS